MKYLITTDFFAEFELIETTNKQRAVDYITSKGKNADGITILGTHDNMNDDDARQQADKVIYITDYID